MFLNSLKLVVHLELILILILEIVAHDAINNSMESINYIISDRNNNVVIHDSGKWIKLFS